MTRGVPRCILRLFEYYQGQGVTAHTPDSRWSLTLYNLLRLLPCRCALLSALHITIVMLVVRIATRISVSISKALPRLSTVTQTETETETETKTPVQERIIHHDHF